MSRDSVRLRQNLNTRLDWSRLKSLEPKAGDVTRKISKISTLTGRELFFVVSYSKPALDFFKCGKFESFKDKKLFFKSMFKFMYFDN